MDALTIVLLTVAVALLAGGLAWYGPRRRHWQTHPSDGDRQRGPSGRDNADRGESED